MEKGASGILSSIEREPYEHSTYRSINNHKEREREAQVREIFRSL